MGIIGIILVLLGLLSGLVTLSCLFSLDLGGFFRTGAITLVLLFVGFFALDLGGYLPEPEEPSAEQPITN
jgi:hypothetical protein